MTNSLDTWRLATELGLLVVAAAFASSGLIVLLRPILVRYALARPNIRSSHRKPTPQGGGIAVIAGTIIAVGCAVFVFPDIFSDTLHLAVVAVATIELTIVGATDDVRPLNAAPRLLLQGIAVALVIATLPAELRIIHVLPWWMERALMLIGGVWFVNLVNFMDGIDWMTVAEFVPVMAGLALVGTLGALPGDGIIVAIALCGTLIGFAPFNRPVARLFLGDVGSLPLGLVLGWLLAIMAGRGHLIEAVLIPLYYLADATITLLRRLINGEPVLQAHRTHFYQRAMDGGFSVYQIVGRVFSVNVVLVTLATVSLLSASLLIRGAALATGGLLVALLLLSFERGRR
jgi:UDP-N-acetylmuramyl pentapeptide phosphotransferase/UDP-N-acetylglucosamine-1-phosphate transferase